MTLPSITGEPTTRAPVGNFHFKRWNSRGPVPGYVPVCAALPRNIDCASAALVRERNRKRKGDIFIKRESLSFSQVGEGWDECIRRKPALANLQLLLRRRV